MIKYFIFQIIILTSCIRGEPPTIINEWKPVKVTMENSSNNGGVVLIYDDKNLKEIKKQLIEEYIAENQREIEDLEADSEASKSLIDREFMKLDTVAYKKDLDSMFSNYKLAKLVFKNDSTVEIDSYGLITPASVPGWNFGNKSKGTWVQNAQNLKFTFGEKEASFSFFYKIVSLKSNNLTLAMTNEEYEDVFMTLEFIKQ